MCCPIPFTVLAQQIDDVATKAAMSFEPSPDDDAAAVAAQQQAVRRRAAAFARAFSAHLQRLQGDATAYGRLGLAELFELREESLREFGFNDIYKYAVLGLDCASLHLCCTLHLAHTGDKSCGKTMLH